MNGNENKTEQVESGHVRNEQESVSETIENMKEEPTSMEQPTAEDIRESESSPEVPMPENTEQTQVEEPVNEEINASAETDIPAVNVRTDSPAPKVDDHLLKDDDSDELETETDEEEHDEAERMIHESDEGGPELDYSTLNQAQLLEAAREANNHNPREAIKRIQEIRSFYLDMLRQQKKDKLQAFLDEGGDPDAFEYDDEEARKAINLIYHQAQEARKEERERIEKEKLQNLARKEELLNQLTGITQSDETENSLQQVKDIQQEWKKIRVVPRENSQELWDRYTFLLDKFYDNHSINLELKDLDRKKNLDIKIDLIKKVEELKNEESLKNSFVLLSKYQEEFRNTGPVPREFSQDIWDRFRAACDGVYEVKKGLFEAVEAERKLNLEKKQLIVEKSALIAAKTYNKIKDWNARSAELDALFEEWKQIGPVPKSKNDQIWKAFRKERNTFYKNRSEYFNQLNNERKANLIIKEDICKRAEALMDSADFNEATREFIRLQEEWKAVGPVPEKLSNALWKRFRSACDHFFTRKKADYEERNHVEIENLNKKKELIGQINALLSTGETEEAKGVVEQLKAIHQEWIKVGYVPRKSVKEIEQTYKDATDSVYKKFGIDKVSAKEGQIEDHYRTMALLPNGRKRLQDEVIRVQKKVRFLEGEIETWENNIGFFSRSKNAEQLRKDIESKISKARGQLSRLNKEMKVLRTLQKDL